MAELVVSALMILSFLGVISIWCIAAGVAALFDGSPVWFGASGIALGVMGLFCAHYHLSLAVSTYRKNRDLQIAAKQDEPEGE